VRRVPPFITNAVILGEGRYGVTFEYDDGRKRNNRSGEP
jgi:hypothetical protein